MVHTACMLTQRSALFLLHVKAAVPPTFFFTAFCCAAATVPITRVVASSVRKDYDAIDGFVQGGWGAQASSPATSPPAGQSCTHATCYRSCHSTHCDSALAPPPLPALAHSVTVRSSQQAALHSLVFVAGSKLPNCSDALHHSSWPLTSHPDPNPDSPSPGLHPLRTSPCRLRQCQAVPWAAAVRRNACRHHHRQHQRAVCSCQRRRAPQGAAALRGRRAPDPHDERAGRLQPGAGAGRRGGAGGAGAGAAEQGHDRGRGSDPTVMRAPRSTCIVS